MAHITGGGLTENVPRMLPSHLAAEIDVRSWPRPGVFAWLGRDVEPREMARAFNNGVGMVMAVEASKVEEVRRVLEGEGERVYEVGRLVERDGKEDGEGCVLRGLEAWTSQ
jgi:phosphoribosylamine--glycine ligase/phosphoribosylformylglycinamidine cyclo-ligase